jgi:hypothetical protein
VNVDEQVAQMFDAAGNDDLAFLHRMSVDELRGALAYLSGRDNKIYAEIRAHVEGRRQRQASTYPAVVDSDFCCVSGVCDFHNAINTGGVA